jgi:hypothetical protein
MVLALITATHDDDVDDDDSEPNPTHVETKMSKTQCN